MRFFRSRRDGTDDTRPGNGQTRPAPRVIGHTLISDTLQVHADLLGQDDLTVSGRVRGNVSGRHVVILAGGIVDGSLLASSLDIDGQVGGSAQAMEITVGPRGYVAAGLHAKGAVDIAGVVNGDVSSAVASVQAGATVDGSIQATDRVSVSGVVRGRIECFTVHITGSGEVHGTVIHNQITIDEGGLVDGPRPWRPPAHFNRG